MTQPLRVYLKGLRGGAQELPAEASHYVARVHRLGMGDRFVAFDPEVGLEADARVVGVSSGRVRCELEETRPAATVGGLAVTLVQAPGKSERLEDVVRAATALGVSTIHVVRSERSVFVPTEKHRERLRVIAVDAARQSGRGDLPRIIGPSSLVTAVDQVTAERRICLHPRAATPLHALLEGWTAATTIALFVGPEGGFSEGELAMLQTSGCDFGALGPLTLRTELASIAALGSFAARLAGASYASAEENT